MAIDCFGNQGTSCKGAGVLQAAVAEMCMFLLCCNHIGFKRFRAGNASRAPEVRSVNFFLGEAFPHSLKCWHFCCASFYFSRPGMPFLYDGTSVVEVAVAPAGCSEAWTCVVHVISASVR